MKSLLFPFRWPFFLLAYFLTFWSFLGIASNRLPSYSDDFRDREGTKELTCSSEETLFGARAEDQQHYPPGGILEDNWGRVGSFLDENDLRNLALSCSLLFRATLWPSLSLNSFKQIYGFPLPEKAATFCYWRIGSSNYALNLLRILPIGTIPKLDLEFQLLPMLPHQESAEFAASLFRFHLKIHKLLRYRLMLVLAFRTKCCETIDQSREQGTRGFCWGGTSESDFRYSLEKFVRTLSLKEKKALLPDQSWEEEDEDFIAGCRLSRREKASFMDEVARAGLRSSFLFKRGTLANSKLVYERYHVTEQWADAFLWKGARILPAAQIARCHNSLCCLPNDENKSWLFCFKDVRNHFPKAAFCWDCGEIGSLPLMGLFGTGDEQKFLATFAEQIARERAATNAHCLFFLFANGIFGHLSLAAVRCCADCSQQAGYTVAEKYHHLRRKVGGYETMKFNDNNEDKCRENCGEGCRTVAGECCAVPTGALSTSGRLAVLLARAAVRVATLPVLCAGGCCLECLYQ